MNTEKRVQRPFTAYLASLCIAAAAVLGWAAIHETRFENPLVWVIFIGLFIMSELGLLFFTVKDARVGLSMTESIMLPMLIALPFAQVVLTIAVAWSIGAVYYRRHGPIKSIFNVASQVVAGAIGVGIASQFNSDGLLEGELLGAAAGTLAFAIATHVFVAAAIALFEGKRFSAELPRATVVNIGGGILLGLLFAAAYLATPLAVVLFPVSQIAITLGYQAIVKQSQERNRIQSLYRASTALAGVPDLGGALVAFLRAVAGTASTLGASAVLEHDGAIRKTSVIVSHPTAVREPVEDGPYLDLFTTMRISGRPMVIDDESPSDQRGLLEAMEVRNLLAVPIREGDVVTGVLMVSDTVGAAHFEEEEQHLLEAQGIELAMSLRSRRLFDEQVRAREENLRLQDQLHQAQRLESVGQLAGGIAHDFNNILAVIGNCSSFVLDELLTMDLTEEQKAILEDVREIKSAADRATSLTRQLLVFSRKDKIEEQVLNVNDVIGELTKLLRRAVGENVSIDLDLNDVASISADPGQIEQVLLNLAINARDAMSGSGTVSIRTSEVELDRAAVANRTGLVQGRYVRLEVTDSGCGMSPAVKEKAFEPFFTTKSKGRGTGLGLSTVYGIVGRARGHIEIDSEPGRGSTFRIYLPAVIEIVVDEPAAVVAESPHGAGETILLVEDELSVRSVARRILDAGGYRVLEAGDGWEALEVMSATEWPVDLVLTDVVMPGMSGFDLKEAIHELNPGMTTLFMTAYSEAMSFPDAVTGSEIIQKPFDKETLLSTIHDVLSKAAAA
ncbi:MAG: ATP-binding protein [Actinomycetota bacterium]